MANALPKYWYCLICATLFVGCTPTSYITNKLNDTFQYAGLVYQSENDPILVREAFPFNLKTLDILIASNPDNIDLLRTATSSYTMYAYGFILEDAKRTSFVDYQKGKKGFTRAQNLFLRARDYGIRALELKYPELENLITKNQMPSTMTFENGDVELLYWTAAAMAGTIISSSANPQFLIQMPTVGWLFQKALETDSDWNNGALYTAMISYSISRPDAGVDAEDIARSYFDKAVVISNGNDCSPFVALAEAVSVKNQNREEFEKLLSQALNIDVNKNLDIRLANILAQDHAKWLLEISDELFY